MLLTTSWWVVLFVLLWWVVQNAQHEGAHALGVKLAGGNVVEYVVYPTNGDGDFSVAFWKSGFSWAHMRYQTPIDAPFTTKQRALISAAPVLANSLWLCGIGLAYLIAKSLDETIPAFLVALYVTNYVDGTWNLGTFYKPEPEDNLKRSDGWSFQRTTGVDKLACRMFAGAWHVAFGALLVF